MYFDQTNEKKRKRKRNVLKISIIVLLVDNNNLEQI